MSVQMIRFHTSRDQRVAVIEQIEALFAGVHAAAPQQMQYIALQENDEPAFTLILELPDGVENPLPSIPAAAAFRSWLPTHPDDHPAPRPCTVVGRYSA